MAQNKYKLSLDGLTYVGRGLSRPECILAQENGTLWISDDKSGVVRLLSNGNQSRIGNLGGAPNGIAMDRDGSLVVANIETGALQRLERNGDHTTTLSQLDGQPLGAVNFALFDSKWRLWVSVSTRTNPRREALNDPRPDGYVFMIENGLAKVMADGFFFTNEIRFSPDETVLYVAETTKGRITAFDVDGSGALLNRRVHGPDMLWQGALVDGVAVDADGALWITEITRNALVVLPPDGDPIVAVEDRAGNQMLFPTSVAFAGSDLQDLIVGSLKMDQLPRLRAPVSGIEPVHWRIG